MDAGEEDKERGEREREGERGNGRGERERGLWSVVTCPPRPTHIPIYAHARRCGGGWLVMVERGRKRRGEREEGRRLDDVLIRSEGSGGGRLAAL